LFVETYKREFGPGATERLVNRLYESSKTTTILNFDNPSLLKGMAEGLYDGNMITTEYLYILSPDAVPTNRLGETYDGTEIGSPLDLLLQNALVFDILDPFRLPVEGNADVSTEDKKDPFWQAWNELDANFVQRINAANPLPSDHEAYWQAPDDFFPNEQSRQLCLLRL
jgi:hypothetical protein